MSWSLNIGKVFGTVVRVHLTFLLFLAWIFAASYSEGGAATAWSSVLFMVLLFLCVLLHEFGHILTARAFGVPTPYVTLLPIGGVAQLERIPEEPGQEFLIAIAGPLVNVAITMSAGLHWRRDAADERRGWPRQHAFLFDRPPGGGEPVPCCIQYDPGLPDGRRPRAARAAGEPHGLRAGDRSRRRDRAIRRLRARLHRLDVQSAADLHRHLRLSRRLVGSAHGGAARRLARRAGEPRHDDAISRRSRRKSTSTPRCRPCCTPARASFRWSTPPASRWACSAAAT